MNVLAIGNSFSQDATRYLHRIARADGVDLQVVNLYIGGCSLERHFRNIQADARVYGLEINGEKSGFSVSVKESLLNRAWDMVTVQQVSNQSICYETYQPYLHILADYVRELAPKAKLAVHQTWAYEQGSERLQNLGFADQREMYEAAKAAYQQAAEDIHADFLIPSGEMFQQLLKKGIEQIHRDTFHASFGLGRYALGLLWYKVFTGRDVSTNNFCDLDEPITQEEVVIAKQSVNEIL